MGIGEQYTLNVGQKREVADMIAAHVAEYHAPAVVGEDAPTDQVNAELDTAEVEEEAVDTAGNTDEVERETVEG